MRDRGEGNNGMWTNFCEGVELRPVLIHTHSHIQEQMASTVEICEINSVPHSHAFNRSYYLIIHKASVKQHLCFRYLSVIRGRSSNCYRFILTCRFVFILVSSKRIWVIHFWSMQHVDIQKPTYSYVHFSFKDIWDINLWKYM